MRQTFCIALTALVGLNVAAASTPQVERGRELFLKSPKGTACGTCHSMAGSGTAVGPDLKKLASAVGPRGMVSAIEMTVTAYVQEAKIADARFPVIMKQDRGEEIEVWDLSQTPPVQRKLTAKQVTLGPNRTWKHPPASAGYTSKELADLVGFLKWAATGTEIEIKVEEVK